MNKIPSKWSVDEVKEFAMKTNSPILYQCVSMHQYRGVSWEIAMQTAAIALSEAYAILQKDHIRILNMLPPSKVQP